MASFAQRLAAQTRKKSPLCVGIDPACGKRELLAFSKQMIAAAEPVSPAVKFNIAFYLRHGVAGMDAFKKAVDTTKDRGLLVIGDVKIGDVPHTAAAYAEAFFDQFGMDAITLNPYLGSDGLQPFLDYCKKDKGVFILCKTSNPASGEVQDIRLPSGGMVYEMVGAMIRKLGAGLEEGYSPVGAVVGATFPREMQRLRQIMPRSLFLVPGYGTQGGRPKDIIHAFDRKGEGAVVAVSRAIANAKIPAQEARRIAGEIRGTLEREGRC